MRIVAAEPVTVELARMGNGHRARRASSLTDRDRAACRVPRRWRAAAASSRSSRRHPAAMRPPGSASSASSSFEVRVVPKLVGGNLGVLEMFDYASGLDALARLRCDPRRSTSGRGPADRPARASSSPAPCERILRDGLLQDYVTREETLGVLRGRLRVDEQVRRRFGRVDQLECRFDELETDVPDNQLLAVGARPCTARLPRTTRPGAGSPDSTACSREAADPAAFDPALAIAEPRVHPSQRALPDRARPRLAVHPAPGRRATCSPRAAGGRTRSCST